MVRIKKEQIQLLVLGAVVVAAGIFAAVNFWLVPMVDQWKKDKAKAIELQAQLEEARAVVRTRTELSAQLDAEQERIQKLLPFLPQPILGNYLLKMDETIRAVAAETALTIKAIANNDILPIAFAENACKLYRVRVDAEGDMNALADFMDKLEKSNPLVNVSSLTIIGQDQTPDRHEIRFLVGWLVWTDPQHLPDYIAKKQPSQEK